MKLIYQSMGKRSSINKQRIIRTLLNNPGGSLTKYQVAKQSMCKFPATHAILKNLQAAGFITGTKTIDYRGLINAWKLCQIKPVRQEYLLKKPLNLLKKTGLKYALTTHFAENLVQRYLVPSVMQFYVHAEDIKQWQRMVKHEDGLVGKGNITILTGDEHVFYHAFSIGSFSVVSIPQLILDLLNEGGIYIRAAEMLISKEQENVISEL